MVHTRNDLVAVDKLKVGDWVLSRPENPEEGTNAAYKRVVNTFKHESRQVLRIMYIAQVAEKKFFNVTSTVDHPFWVAGEGWTTANGILGDWMGPSRLVLKDGTEIDSDGKVWIYATDDPNVGWIADNGIEGEGALWDYAQAKLLQNGKMYDWQAWCPSASRGSDDDLYAPFLTTVYNIEVEDYHTYFVGTHGVWVHDADCARIKPASGITPKR